MIIMGHLLQTVLDEKELAKFLEVKSALEKLNQKPFTNADVIRELIKNYH